MSLTQNRNAPQQNKLILSTAVPVDNQFPGGRPQIRYSARILVGVGGTNGYHIRNTDLSFFSKYYLGNGSSYACAVDADHSLSLIHI